MLVSYANVKRQGHHSLIATRRDAQKFCERSVNDSSPLESGWSVLDWRKGYLGRWRRPEPQAAGKNLLGRGQSLVFTLAAQASLRLPQQRDDGEVLIEESVTDQSENDALELILILELQEL